MRIPILLWVTLGVGIVFFTAVYFNINNHIASTDQGGYTSSPGSQGEEVSSQPQRNSDDVINIEADLRDADFSDFDQGLLDIIYKKL